MASANYNGNPNITLLRLVATYPDRFYPQDWYYDEEFANEPLETGDYVHTLPLTTSKSSPTAVAVAWMYLRFPELENALEWAYVWTSDVDRNGDRIYVGGWNLSRKKGFQIHRHIVRPNILNLKYKYKV